MSLTSNSAKKPFMQAFIESSVPTDVIAAAEEEFSFKKSKRSSTSTIGSSNSGRSSGGMKSNVASSNRATDGADIDRNSSPGPEDL